MTDSKNPTQAHIASVADYTLLGRSGLRVSPLCLGTMTFGTDWGWGSPEGAARDVLHRYLEVGGNFIDTADIYTNGRSEEMLGKFLADGLNRDKLVIASKYTINVNHPGDPNAGGNSRKNLQRAIEGTLRRLRTDYLDLYWLHAWDGLTPVEEVMRALDEIVRAGKVRYIGLSDTPAWYLARAQTLAQWRGFEPICALQLEYSLTERNIEREHIPAAIELGMGVCPWSPLAGGMLTGKYQRGSGTEVRGDGRLMMTRGTGAPGSTKLDDARMWRIVDTLTVVAKEVGLSPAQVALNWVARRPGVTSTIIGATKLSQLDDNLQSLTHVLPPEITRQLDEAGQPDLVFPYTFFSPERRASSLHGGTSVRAEPRNFRG